MKFFGLIFLLFIRFSRQSVPSNPEASSNIPASCADQVDGAKPGEISIRSLVEKNPEGLSVLPSVPEQNVKSEGHRENSKSLKSKSSLKRKTPCKVERPFKCCKTCPDCPYFPTNVEKTRSVVTTRICKSYLESHPTEVLPEMLYMVEFFFPCEKKEVDPEFFFKQFPGCIGFSQEFGSGPMVLFNNVEEAFRVSFSFKPHPKVIEICNC